MKIEFYYSSFLIKEHREQTRDIKKYLKQLKNKVLDKDNPLQIEEAETLLEDRKYKLKFKDNPFYDNLKSIECECFFKPLIFDICEVNGHYLGKTMSDYMECEDIDKKRNIKLEEYNSGFSDFTFETITFNDCREIDGDVKYRYIARVEGSNEELENLINGMNINIEMDFEYIKIKENDYYIRIKDVEPRPFPWNEIDHIPTFFDLVDRTPIVADVEMKKRSMYVFYLISILNDNVDITMRDTILDTLTNDLCFNIRTLERWLLDFKIYGKFVDKYRRIGGGYTKILNGDFDEECEILDLEIEKKCPLHLVRDGKLLMIKRKNKSEELLKCPIINIMLK